MDLAKKLAQTLGVSLDVRCGLAEDDEDDKAEGLPHLSQAVAS